MYLIADDLGTEELYAQENYICYNIVARVFLRDSLLTSPTSCTSFCPCASSAPFAIVGILPVVINDLLLSR
jgi:hypothetical protein